MHHNLIFFEGLTGSGKSTLSQWLAWRLAERGQVVRWCSEMSASHPFDDPDIKHDLLGDDFLKKAVEGWALAAQRMADFDGVWVLDCGPLQKTAMLALHLGLGVDLIEEALVQIGTQLSPLNPKMICFHQDSVCDQVRSIYQQRGERFCDALVEWTDRSAVPEARKGIEGSCDFWQSYAQICTELSPTLCDQVETLDSSLKDWDGQRRVLSQLFSLPEEPPLPPVNLDFIGTYRRNDRPGECRLFMQDGALVLTGLMEPLESFSALISLGNETCVVRGQDVILRLSDQGKQIEVESGWKRLKGVVLTQTTDYG